MSTQKSDKVTIESAFGFSATKQPPTDKAITFPLTVDYTYDVFSTPDEAVNAGYNFVKLANTAEKNKSKASAYQKAINALKPDANDPLEVRKRLIKDIMAMGKSEAEAEALVASLA